MSQFSTDGVVGNTANGLRASEIARSLTDHLEDVPARLGQTDIRMYPDEIRIGTNDHISIVRRDGNGKRRGWWTDFKADASGTDMLDYAAHILGSSTANAMRWAAGSFKIDTIETRREQPRQQDGDRHSALITKIRSASRIWEQTRPLAGTVGETYFRETRGITCPIGSAIRFHPNLYHRSSDGVVSYWPAIVCAVMIAPNSYLTGVWRIYLSRDGQKAPVDKAKKGLGATFGHGGAVRLTDASSHRLHIAEGVENGLSAISMKPDISVWCAMAVSGFGNVSVPSHVTHATILADNDPSGSPAHKSLMNGAKALAQRIQSVGVVRPPAEFKDLNAMLISGGF